LNPSCRPLHYQTLDKSYPCFSQRRDICYLNSK
jgi:hypothetical protein